MASTSNDVHSVSDFEPMARESASALEIKTGS